MAILLDSFEKCEVFLPCAPEFDRESGEWLPATRVAAMVQLTPQGLLQMRRRMGHRYEHREKNQVFLYTPCWLRLWFFDESERKR